MLQNQIDGLFSALEQRANERTERLASYGHRSPHFEIDDGMGFKIVMIGDSTIRVRSHGSMFMPPPPFSTIRVSRSHGIHVPPPPAAVWRVQDRVKGRIEARERLALRNMVNEEKHLRDIRGVEGRYRNENVYARPNGLLREKAETAIPRRGPGPARKKKEICQ